MLEPWILLALAFLPLIASYRALEHQRKNGSEESAILLERVTQRFLPASLLEAQADWPADLPAPPSGVNFRRVGEGAWLEIRTEYSGTEADTVFPLTITNDGPGPVTDMQGSVMFYDPTQAFLPSRRPHEVFSCFGLVVDHLAPGESRPFKCRFISSTYAFRTTQEQVLQWRRLREGSLRPWIPPMYLDHVSWRATAADPLNPDEVARYVQLKSVDRRYAQRAILVRTGVMSWLSLGSILLAGFVVPDLANRVLSRKGVLAVSVAGAAAFIVGLALGNIVIARCAARDRLAPHPPPVDHGT